MTTPPPNPMRLLIAGASGRLGSRVVSEALAAGHAVTALSRQPSSLGLSHPDLRLAAVDVRDPDAVARVMPGHDAVISTLGYKRAGERADVLEVGVANLIASMQAHGVNRIVAVASAGILQLDDTRLRCERPGYPEAFKAGSAAHRRVWERLEASGLGWTLVCPPELVEGDREQPLRTQANVLPEGPLHVSMEALARWIIATLSGDSWRRTRVGILDAVSS